MKDLKIPQLTPEQTEGHVEAWVVPTQTAVAFGQVIAQLGSGDKASVDFECKVAGTLVHRVAAGEALLCGDVFGSVLGPDDAAEDFTRASDDEDDAPAPAPEDEGSSPYGRF